MHFIILFAIWSLFIYDTAQTINTHQSNTMNLSYPQPYPNSILQATYKQNPSDFIVTEQMAVEFSGYGEHLWVFIKKTNLNTVFVAKLLAKWANIGTNHIGYSGLKDRHAVTYQWFSLHLPNRQPPVEEFDKFIQAHLLAPNEKIDLLECHWHHKKLNRGTHKTNHFQIILRDVVGDSHAINTQLSAIAHNGVPNYFGEQRFGHDNNNLHTANEFFIQLCASNTTYKPRKKELATHALYISVAKSAIFNAILAERVCQHTWNTAIEGDVFNLDGTKAFFSQPVDDTIIHRITHTDIHPTAILFGTGTSKSTADALALEESIISLPKFANFKAGLLKTNNKLSYRSLRLIPKNLAWQWQDGNLHLQFSLPSGTFATSILSALIQTKHNPNLKST